MMTRVEMKTQAKAQLGNKIFGNLWMTALLVCLIFTLLEYAAGALIPGIGAIIITGPICYGVGRLFLNQRRHGGTMNIGEIFKGFTEDFGQNFLIGLMTAIFTALWSLLLVVPGIVKAYAYSMAYYIKVDHPDYSWKECINASREMMDGHKWELFVLDLSFIGWYIVGALVLGVGVLWVMPYHEATHAIFYEQICGAPVVYTEPASGDNGWY